MKIEPTKLKDLLLITPDIYEDERGFFSELYRKDTFKEVGIKKHFIQDNQSRSKKNVVRGLHFQWNPKLSKLIRVSHGKAWMVAVDIRKKSPTFRNWVGIEVSDLNRVMIYAPFGFATGFCALSETTDVLYKYDALYNKQGESNILWNDPTINIKWPTKNPSLSPRDSTAQPLKQWLERPESDLF